MIIPNFLIFILSKVIKTFLESVESVKEVEFFRGRGLNNFHISPSFYQLFYQVSGFIGSNTCCYNFLNILSAPIRHVLCLFFTLKILSSNHLDEISVPLVNAHKIWKPLSVRCFQIFINGF